jgi:hypothetical protein
MKNLHAFLVSGMAKLEYPGYYYALSSSDLAGVRSNMIYSFSGLSTTMLHPMG